MSSLIVPVFIRNKKQALKCLTQDSQKAAASKTKSTAGRKTLSNQEKTLRSVANVLKNMQVTEISHIKFANPSSHAPKQPFDLV